MPRSSQNRIQNAGFTPNALPQTSKHRVDEVIAQNPLGNARVKVMGNSIMITKQASGTAKIDPLMALFDAAALLLDHSDADLSVYTADRGLVVFG